VPPASGGGGNCDPAPSNDPDGQSIHFCDGPDLPSSPGICYPLTTPPTSGEGECLPACTYALDGSAPTGCPTGDTCFPINAFGFDTNNNPIAFGYCQGTCQADSDCSPLGAGYVCQVDIGACTKTPLKRTKSIGQACSAPTTTDVNNDNALGNCNCLPDTTTNEGYCTSACVVGGDLCPAGWVCDNLQPSAVQLPDGTVSSITKENVNTSGVCMPTCTSTDAGVSDGAAPVVLDAGADAAASDGGVPNFEGVCPAGSACENQSPVGPDCVP
jgi:hypothetical protein